MNNLIVYLNAERVGTLEQDDSGLMRFSYNQVWLEKPGAMSLSRSLPLQSDENWWLRISQRIHDW